MSKNVFLCEPPLIWQFSGLIFAPDYREPIVIYILRLIFCGHESKKQRDFTSYFSPVFY